MWLDIQDALRALYSRWRMTACFTLLLSSAMAALLVAGVLALQAHGALPYEQAARLVWVDGELRNAQGETTLSESLSAPAAWRLHETPGLFDLATPVYYTDMLYVNHPQQPRIAAALVEPGYFSLFNMSLQSGHYFSASSLQGQQAQSAAQAVVSARFARRYLPDQEATGQVIQLDDRRFQVVGILAQNSHEPELFRAAQQSDVFLPFFSHTATDITPFADMAIRNNLMLVGRTLPQANTVLQTQALQLSADIKALSRQYGFGDTTLKLTLRPLDSKLKGALQEMGTWLLGAALGVVTVTLCNLFALYLLDFKSRQSQLALHLALGARPSHLFRQLLCHAVALFALSALAATALAPGLLALVQYWGEEVLGSITWLHLSWSAYLGMWLVALLLAWGFARSVFAFVELRSLRQQLSGSGKGQVKQLPGWLSQLLINAQLATGMVVLCFSLWLLSYYGAQMSKAQGFDDTGLIQVQMQQLDFERSEQKARARRLLSEANIDTLLAQPQIAAVSLSANHPLEMSWVEPISAVPDSARQLTAFGQWSGVGYFATVGQRVLAGTEFSAEQLTLDAPAEVVIINQGLAGKLGLTLQDVGVTLYSRNQRPVRLQAIVEDVYSPALGTPDIVYLPHNFFINNLMIRLAPGQSLLKSDLNALLRVQDTRQSVFQLSDMTARSAAMSKSARLSAYTGIALSSLMVILVGTGLYGVLGYLALLSAPVWRIKWQLGAKTGTLIREHLIGRVCKVLPVAFVSLLLLFGVCWVFKMAFTGLLSSFVVAVTLMFLMALLLDYYHTIRQLKDFC
ncbi:ABC transporter permease [Pseudoalteromonas sp. OOF1S-7]|uniref:ABC transporter permease n=1 Tax=Pseudoalteromonas sp. OOF1S-7 TaxID=2917757 RepID=UPI001EF4C042|nr:ABC transporter permease [Pseudoalteromonas sp. OOF1S-7]MCG7536062.1 ABC transporter permease [Pseudoalteromonas sp. OOF1S-7]